MELLRRIAGNRLLAKIFGARYSTTTDPQVVPVQRRSYEWIVENVVADGDRVLDVGFGLGYGVRLMAAKAGSVSGVDVDQKAVRHATRIADWPDNVSELRAYDGVTIPFEDEAFDVTTCIDVVEHVPDYEAFIREMLRVSKRAVAIATPNRRPEYTNPDGTPKNHWHLREWTADELDAILRAVPGCDVRWCVVNGPFSGPFTVSSESRGDTLALLPVLQKR